eukprot:TRINITY_DN209_c0_g1_i1.p1 TRINITY_DN209_c0_g1~~TRINITY_DN209_c0_g1_i1.p1  ORF type:complete len:1920 (-),score=413.24 TRINITY_DN209_c0_g1_i1:1070-6829(-)
MVAFIKHYPAYVQQRIDSADPKTLASEKSETQPPPFSGSDAAGDVQITEAKEEGEEDGFDDIDSLFDEDIRDRARQSLFENFSVQLFTVAQLSEEAVHNETHLLDQLFSHFQAILSRTVTTSPNGRVQVVNSRHKILEWKVYGFVATDIRYTLQHKKNALYFVERDNLALIKILFQVLEWIQLTHINYRISSGTHIEFELENWIYAYSLELEVLHMMPPLLEATRDLFLGKPEVSGGRDTKPIATQLCKLIVHSLLARLFEFCVGLQFSTSPLDPNNPSSLLVVNVETSQLMPRPSGNIRQTITEKDFLSYHLPLHRYLANFFHLSTILWQAPLESLVVGHDSKLLPLFMIVHPLQIRVAQSQIKAGLWSRNGHEVWAQSVMYDSVHSFDLLKDLDMLLLQIGAVLLGGNQFVLEALSQFDLLHQFVLGKKPPPEDPTPALASSSLSENQNQNDSESKPEEDKKKEEKEAENTSRRILIEDLLTLIISVATERAKIGMTDEEEIRRELIHRLAAGDHSHSELTKNISKRLVKNERFEKVLNDVSVYNTPQGMEQGNYTLKPECWAEFDRYFGHYVQKDIQEAEEKHREFRKTPNASASISSPTPATPFPTFSSVSNVLHSHLVHSILFYVFHSYLHDLNTDVISEAAYLSAIHILDLSLRLVPVGLVHSGPVGRFPNSGLQPGELNVLDIEFPSSWNIMSNLRHHVPVPPTEKDLSPAESLLSLIFKLSRKSASGEQQENRTWLGKLLAKIGEADEINKQQIAKLTEGSQQIGTPGTDAERRRKLRERQAAILANFHKKLQDFEEKPGGVAVLQTPPPQSQPSPARTDVQEQDQQEGSTEVHFSTQCALCRESTTSLHDRPIAFVAWVQTTRVPAVAKEQALRDIIPQTVGVPSTTTSAPASRGDGGSKTGAGASASSELAVPPCPSHDRRSPAKIASEATKVLGLDDADSDVDGSLILPSIDMLDDDSDDNEEVPFGEEVDDDDIVRATGFMYSLMYDDERNQMPMHLFGEHDDLDEDEDSDDELQDAEIIDVDDNQEELPEIEEDPEAEADVDVDVEPQAEDGEEESVPDAEGEDGVEDQHATKDGEEDVLVEAGDDDEEGMHDDDEDDDDDEELEQFDEDEDAANQEDLEGLGRFILSLQPFDLASAEGGSYSDDDDDEDDEDEDEEFEENDEDPQHTHQTKEKDKDKSKQDSTNKNQRQTVRNGMRELHHNWNETVGVHVQFCGHQIHVDCFDRYFSALVRSHVQNNEYEGDQLIDLQSMEFLCPICRRLGNTLLPLVPDNMLLPSPGNLSIPTSLPENFDGWLRSVQNVLMVPSNPPENKNHSSTQSSDTTPAETPVEVGDHPLGFTALENSLDAFVTKLYSVQCHVGHESVIPDERATPFFWSALGVTVASSEIAGRDESVLIPTEEKQAKLFKALMRAGLAHRRHYPRFESSVKEGQPWTGDKLKEGEVTETGTVRGKQLELLRQIIAGETASHIPSGMKVAPLLCQDIFGVVVRLVLIWPRRLSRGDLSNIVRLLYLAHLVQAVASFALTNTKLATDLDKNKWRKGFPRVGQIEQVSSLETLFQFVDGCLNNNIRIDTTTAFPATAIMANSPSGAPVSPADLEKSVHVVTLAFLRRTAIFVSSCVDFFHQGQDQVFGVPEPWAPTEIQVGGDLSNYSDLLGYLRLSSPQEMMSSLSSTQRWILRAWLRDMFIAISTPPPQVSVPVPVPVQAPINTAVSTPTASGSSSSGPASVAAQQITSTTSTGTAQSTGTGPTNLSRHRLVPRLTPPDTVHLIPLPNLYQDFFAKYVEANCDHCGAFTTQSAVCLICGAVLCGDRCCPEHAQTCCADVGMFLITNSTVVLLLRGARFCFWGSPYLDDHGEEDLELRRGKPLYLSHSRYNQLKRLWVTHGMDHDSHILAHSQREQDEGWF